MPIYAAEFLDHQEQLSVDARNASFQANTDMTIHLESKDKGVDKMEAKKGNFSASNISRLLDIFENILPENKKTKHLANEINIIKCLNDVLYNAD